MKRFISLIVISGFMFSNIAFAAKKTAKVKAPNRITYSVTKWNKVCQDLLENSVKSTLKLEKSVMKKKKVSKKEFEDKIQNELLVVQLNAWVCALSTKKQMGVAAEELFLKNYSELVQSKRL